MLSGSDPNAKHTNHGWWQETSPEKPAHARKASLTVRHRRGDAFCSGAVLSVVFLSLDHD